MLAVLFFSGSAGVALGEGVTLGVSVGDGDDDTLSDGDEDGEAVGDGEFAGLGEGLCFREGEPEADFSLSGVGPGLVLRTVFGLPDALGVGLGVSFPSLLLEAFRCLRDGVGVGGAKIFLILSPNDSSAARDSAQ